MLQGARELGVHQFAFSRESLLGLDLAAAFHRYLAWSETTTDVRHVQTASMDCSSTSLMS